MNGTRYIKNVVTLKLDSSRCVGCGMCLEVCPHEVFVMEKRVIRLQDKDACMECGACARNCPAGALYVRAGVGCAYAIVMGKLKGTEPVCGCSGEESGCC